MRYLILSDIHANLTALNAALDAAKGQWDQAVCLGDLVDYGPDPNEAVDRVRSLEAETIRGNHDKAVVGLLDGEDFNPLAQAALLWTREQLRPDNRAYLETLPKGPLSIDGFSIVHGAFHDEDEYVLHAVRWPSTGCSVLPRRRFLGTRTYKADSFCGAS